MTPKKEETVADKAKRGEFTLVAPLDYILLGFAPEEGQLVFGLYPLGETTANIGKKLTPEQQKIISNETLGGRMRVLLSQGLVKMEHSGVGTGGKHIWQRTKLGTKVLNDWKGNNGGGA